MQNAIASHSGSPSSWHSASDADVRGDMRNNMLQFLVELKKGRTGPQDSAGDPSFERQLRETVDKLEDKLYRQASSREEYIDKDTLKQRILVCIGKLHTQGGKPQAAMAAAAQAAVNNAHAAAGHGAHGAPGDSMPGVPSYAGGAMPANGAAGGSSMAPGFPPNAAGGYGSGMYGASMGQRGGRPPGGYAPTGLGGAAPPGSLSLRIPAQAAAMAMQTHSVRHYSTVPSAPGASDSHPSSAVEEVKPPMPSHYNGGGMMPSGMGPPGPPNPINPHGVPPPGMGGPGIMSNGAPLLLRGQRDWSSATTSASISGPGAHGIMPSHSVPVGGVPNPLMRGALGQQGGPQSIPNSSGMMPGHPPPGLQVPNGSIPVRPPNLPTSGPAGPGPASAQALEGLRGHPHPHQAMQHEPKPSMQVGMLPTEPPGMPGPGSGLGGPPPGLKLEDGGGLLGSVSGPGGEPDQKKQDAVKRHASWLLILKHSTRCIGNCAYGAHCQAAKELWAHMKECKDPACQHPRCKISLELLKHFTKCQVATCPICVPVREVLKTQQAKRQQQMMEQQGMGPGPQPHPMVPLQPPGMPPGGRMDPQDARRAKEQLMRAKQQQQQDEEERKREALAAAKRRRVAETAEYLGSSMLETFTMDEIKTHVASLRSRDPTRTETDRWNMDVKRNDETCRACGMERMLFEPLPLYCTGCSQRIKKGQVFYSCDRIPAENRPYLCSGCYNETRGDIKIDDFTRLPKSQLEKKKLDEDVVEPWVQCDRCNSWIHQICGLFNKGRNDEELPYHCPHCLYEEFADAKRKPIAARPQCFLEARDLPKCSLSSYLEERMQKAMDIDRRARAAALGVSVEQVPAVDGLTVRVVNSIDKKCEVKPRFMEAYKHEAVHPEHKYKQKVVLLFQKIEGVDVCLFCMYTQEYGQDVSSPNTRSCYLSYLDSVKYFRPEIDCADKGLQLRSMVYHELLIGYLDWLRNRGFCEMFIWACPPMQGDDYILYCHPTRQKNPKSDRLREWYLRMLRKAQADGVIHHCTNMFDRYFDGGREHRLPEVSMGQVPYYEGDYWPGEAENLLDKIGEEGRTQGKKAAKGRPKTAQTAKGKRGAGPATTDEQLMARLGETISQMREDFIVVHFRPTCSFCRKYFNGEIAFFAPQHLPPTAPQSLNTAANAAQRREFALCSDCYSMERTRQENQGDLPVRMGGTKSFPPGVNMWDLEQRFMPALPDTKDPDPDQECEIFESRSNFLSLCQGNHFQFDTLRRAKHSSMMVLYHLHNPDEPAFASTCNTCSREIEPGRGYRCTVCTDYDLCDECYRQQGHPHPMHHSRQRGAERRERMSEADLRERQRTMERWLLLLQHSATCNNPSCPSGSCKKFKQLLEHVRSCTARNQEGGCIMCKKLLALIQHHSRSCKAGLEDCPVPFCNAIRQSRRAQLARQEQTRRQNYVKMMRASTGKQG